MISHVNAVFFPLSYHYRSLEDLINPEFKRPLWKIENLIEKYVSQLLHVNYSGEGWVPDTFLRPFVNQEFQWVKFPLMSTKLLEVLY